MLTQILFQDLSSSLEFKTENTRILPYKPKVADKQEAEDAKKDEVTNKFYKRTGAYFPNVGVKINFMLARHVYRIQT